MRNILSVDVEDYFQVEAFAATISPDQWHHFEPRVERNTFRILELFARHETKATFFVLGWVAERFPRLVREIAGAGHEIGSHGYGHSRLHRLTPAEFRRDIARSTAILTDQVQRPIVCYRAPSFSIVKNTLWALDILVEEGFRFDSSIFPIRHDLYGIPDAERFPHWQRTPQGLRIFEFPPSTRRIGNMNLGVAGGGYLRLFPYSVTCRTIQHLNETEGQPAMVYFHPWEIDPDQPTISAGMRSRLRHYTNLSRMERKVGKLLRDFRFSTFSHVAMEHQAYTTADASSSTAALSASAAVVSESVRLR